MTYLVYQDGNKWRIAREDGRLDRFTKAYDKNTALSRAFIAFSEDQYKVYEMFEREPQELRFLN